MHGLATLSRATEAASFNKDFYTAVSAIIPVLFLALVVETKTYLAPLQAARILLKKIRQKNALIVVLVSYALAPLIYAPLAIIVAGAWGEFLAVYALYQGQAGDVTGLGTLWSTIFLVAVVAIGPIWNYFAAVFGDGEGKRLLRMLMHRTTTGDRPSVEAPPRVSDQPGWGDHPSVQFMALCYLACYSTRN
jgi:hypothetical protein